MSQTFNQYLPVAGRIMALQRSPHPNPETCESATLHGKRLCRCHEVKDFQMGDYPELFEYAQ